MIFHNPQRNIGISGRNQKSVTCVLTSSSLIRNVMVRHGGEKFLNDSVGSFYILVDFVVRDLERNDVDYCPTDDQIAKDQEGERDGHPNTATFFRLKTPMEIRAVCTRV